MRVSLIYPLLSRERSVVDENKQFWPPLGLAYISAFLNKNGYNNVQVIDRDLILRKNNFDFECTDKLTLESIVDFRSDIVGISMTTPNFSDVRGVLGMIKTKYPNILTIIGGPHCTGEPFYTMEVCKDADILVKGEGEKTLLDIVSGKKIEEIEGILYRRDDGSIKQNPDRPLINNIDELPFPARHILDMDFYLRPNRFIGRNLNLRTTHIFTARGCPFECSYCAGPIMGKRKVRYHSPKRVIDEIIELIDKYRVEAIYFAEDMFLSNKKRAKEIFSMMKDRRINKKIVWMAQLSTNAVDEDYLRMMKEAGCVHVEYGFESGSQRILKLMNKKSSIEQNIKAAEITKRVGMRFQGNFIVGYPGESEDDFNATLSFIKMVRPSHIAMNIFMPLPGTAIYNALKLEGKDMPPWDTFGDPDAPQFNYADMSVGRFRFLYDRARLRLVLPLNLVTFLKDNIKHPIRLLYVIFCQFRGIFIKTSRSYLRLKGYKLIRI